MANRHPTSELDTAAHVIAVVGRPNVGKSAIFNRLAGRRIAIVHDQPGVTRDRITAAAKTRGRPFFVMDTGGIGAGLDDGFAEQIAAEVDIALAEADLIFFVVDAKDGMTPVDEALAAQLRKAGRPVFLLVNKVDHDAHRALEADFASLGFDHSYPVSAAHGRGFAELLASLERVLATLPPPAALVPTPSDDPIKVAIVGRPNVGKSSLVNAILKSQRTIVSEIAGTTRDAVDVPYRHGEQDYLLIDTAGMRKRTRRDSSVEVFSAMRSERSIRRADICALVVDASKGVTSQDRRIATAIVEAHKPCVVLLNKFDLYHPDASKKDRLAVLQDEVGRDLFFIPYAPLVALSALKGQYVNRLFTEINRVREAAGKTINTGTLNRILERALLKSPPPLKSKKRLKLLYASVAKDDKPGPIPVPRYIFFINHANLLSSGYLRYLEAQIREESAFEGLPIEFQIRDRPPKKKVARRAAKG